MSKAEEFRKQADTATERAQAARSLGEGARERKRAAGLRQLADNEDWLEGKAPVTKADKA